MPDALLRALDLTVGRRVAGLLAGDYRSQQAGEGSELAQIRPYVPGDDVRRIDWNVMARTREPHVRVDLAERVLATWLVLDASASMQFGTAERRKADVAEGVAIALAHVATRRGNRLGVATFGDETPRALPPRQGRIALLGLLSVLRAQADATRVGTSLGEGLRSTGALARQRALVAIVAVEIRDPREQELPNVGELWLVDPETGRQLRVNTRSARLRERFAAAAHEERQAVADAIRAAGVRHVVLSTEGDWLRPLALFLRRSAA
jgi:uncharacterized protein (DUF58 family)